MTNRITLLGATGSIGDSTLDVVARHPDRFEVVALAAADTEGQRGALADFATRTDAALAALSETVSQRYLMHAQLPRQLSRWEP